MSDIPAGYSRLEKSERRALRGAQLIRPAEASELISVSVRVRRRPGAPALPNMNHFASKLDQSQRISRDEFASRYGASLEDMKQVTDFATAAGLKVVETSVSRRTVVLSGTVGQMSAAFAVSLGHYKSAEQEYRGREGFIYVPAHLAKIIEGVFGLDNRRMARRASNGSGITPVTPPQVAKLYNFPTSANGFGQTIGLLEFGGGYLASDITDYFTTNLGIGPGYAAPALATISVDGVTNSPDSSNESAEVLLDISVAGSVAQGARIAVYFAPFTEQGWIDIVTTAIYDVSKMPAGWAMPSVISISWDWGEFEQFGSFDWSQAAIDAVSTTFQEAATLFVTVFVASGDNGSNCQVGDGKAHVYYPASDPWVCSCGGTTIENISGSNFKEITWNDNGVTGGGISDAFPLPSWQEGKGIPKSVNSGGRIGRGIPDIAGYANGYNIVMNGAVSVGWWGTSETAPLYAGLIAIINSVIGLPVGYLNPILYSLAGSNVLANIADGASNAVLPAPGYTATAGWNACTGLGRLNGAAFLSALQGMGVLFSSTPVSQAVLVGDPAVLTIQVKDINGSPMAGVSVAFTVTSGGSLSNTQNSTNSQGYASATLVALSAGIIVVTVTSGVLIHSPVTFFVTALAVGSENTSSFKRVDYSPGNQEGI